MALTDAPKTPSTQALQPGTGSAGETSLVGLLTYLIPPVAGLCIGIAIDSILTNDSVVDGIWTGASIDPDSLPAPLVTKAAGLAAGLVLWFLSAMVVKGGRPWRSALRTTAFGFVSFFSILALNTLNGVVGMDVVEWSPLAVIVSLAFLTAWTAVSASANGGRMAVAAAGFLRRRAVIITLCAGAVYCAVSIAMGLLQWRAVMISYRDCGNLDEVMWKTLHGQFLMCSQYSYNVLGEHVGFIQLFLLPIYALWPGLPSLMIPLSIALASGVIPVYRLAMDRLNSPAAAALFSVAYVLYAPMQYLDKEILDITFLPEMFYVPLMLWAIYFFLKRQMWRLLVVSFFILACKEELALPLAMMGLVMAARRQWKWGIAFFVGGTMWFLVSFMVVVPCFAGGSSHVLNPDYYGEYGTSVSQILRSVFLHPFRALSLMCAFQHLDLLAMMLVPFGCLALLSPTMLFVFLPSIASGMLCSYPASSTIYFHWHLSITPLPIAGAILGTANLARILPRFSLLWGRIEQSARAGVVIALCAVLVFVSSGVFDVVYGKVPWSLKFYNPNSNAYWRYLYVRTPAVETFLTKVLPTIPRDAAVCASWMLDTRFAHHAAAYRYPEFMEKADYVVVQRYEPVDQGLSYVPWRQIGDEEQLAGFERIFAEGGVYVFKRKPQSGDNPGGSASPPPTK